MVALTLLAACGSWRTMDRSALEDRYAGPPSEFVELDEVEGLRVHVRDEGTGPPLLFLHGAGSSLHTWDAWARQLRWGYRVVRIDLPPFGLSDRHPEDRYGPEAYLEVMDALMEALEIEDPVVVGNSVGGYVAARYAAHNPEGTRGAVLLAPAGYPQTLPGVLRLVALRGLGRAVSWLTPRWLVERTVRRAYADPERVPAAVVDRHHELLRGPGNRQGFRDVVLLMDDLRLDEPNWVEDVTVPTLLMWGEEDRFVPVELAPRWLEDLPDAELVRLPDVGHVPMEEAPVRSLALLRPFLARQGVLPRWDPVSGGR